MERFGGRDPYIDKDPARMVPELVENREERLVKAAELKAKNFIEKSRSSNLESDNQYIPTPEERRVVFNEQVLSRLDTETYMQVWAAGAPHYLSHVSRHGFRDHAGMMEHTGGMNEFSNAAFSMLADSKLLRSHLGGSKELFGTPNKIKESLRKWLEPAKNKKEAQERVGFLFDYGLFEGGHYPDRTAMHLAAEVVSDDLYGGERDNEFFVIFPADFVASQYTYSFNTGQADFTKPCDAHKWNDIWVWPKEKESNVNAGMSLDAGLVFLPRSTIVDPETGSKYLSKVTENGRERIYDKELLNRLLEHFTNPGYFNDVSRDEYYDRSKEFDDKVNQSLQQFGLPSLHYFNAGEISDTIVYSRDDSSACCQRLTELFERNQLVYKKSTSENGGISAEEFWGEYFQKYPNRKPKHIVFYDGSPTESVQDFFREKGVNSKYSKYEPLLGFDKNQAIDREDDPRTNPWRQKLDFLTKEVIDEMFPE